MRGGGYPVDAASGDELPVRGEVATPPPCRSTTGIPLTTLNHADPKGGEGKYCEALCPKCDGS